MSLDGFSMYPLALELNNRLAGGRIDKITQPSKQSVVLSVRQPGENFLFHITINPQNPAAHILSKPMENPPEPPTFCMVLRKQLETGRIAGVRQVGLDRILSIDMDFIGMGGAIITKALIIELVGKYSNIIILQDGKIIDSLRKVGANSSRIRTVLPGQDYVLPPAQDKISILPPFDSAVESYASGNIPEISDTALNQVITAVKYQPEEKLFKAVLNSCLGFGPVSARETVFSAGLPKNLKVSEMDDADFSSLKDALCETAAACLDSKPTLIADKNNKVLAMSAFPLYHMTEGLSDSNAEIRTESFDTVSQLLERAGKLVGSYQLPDKDMFKKLVKNERVRAENKYAKLEDDIATAENADEFRIKADNLMTYQYQLKDHEDAEITLDNIYSESGEKITIKLDQKYTISQNIQGYYKKYDKLKRAQSMIKEQLAHCGDEINYLRSIESSLNASSTIAEINDIRAELVAGGYLRGSNKKKMYEKPSKPFKFVSKDDTVILVGKNNYQNDKLTFKTAAYNDIWLHAKDIPGSHVVIKCEGITPSDDTLLLAAELAAHFSQASDSSKVPVDYTAVRYVKKPSGAKPGFVIFTNQTTLMVTPNSENVFNTLKNDLNA